MKTIATTLLIAASFSAAFAANTDNTYEINSKSVSLQSSSQPGITGEKTAVHFSYPVKGEVFEVRHSEAANLTSDEYWFHVSGSDFKKGFQLDISDPGATVRFSALAKPVTTRSNSYSTESTEHRAKEIDLNQLIISKNNQELPSAIAYMTPEADLARASLFNDSSLLQLDDAVGAGSITLRSRQSLSDHDRYLVNVKENNSSKKLHISAPRLNMLAGETLSFHATLKDEQKLPSSYRQYALSDSRYQSYLVSPNGQKVDIQLSGSAENGWSVQLPDSLPQAKPGELYSLYMDAVSDNPDGLIRRKVKLAFAVAKPTAQVEHIKADFDHQRGAEITLNIASEGRYEVRGTLYGTDDNGQLKSIMRSHSGYWLKPGLQSIELALDKQIIKNSGLKAPYHLVDFELMDQSQLRVLHSQKIAI